MRFNELIVNQPLANDRLPTAREIDKFIANLTFPKLGSFVVSKLVQKCLMSREQAIEAWESHQKRIG